MAEEKAFSTALTKVNDTFFPMIQKQLDGNGIKMDGYARQCVLNAISSINDVLDSKGITWNDSQLDKSNITQTLLSVASLKLNAAASPREIYFQTRNVKVKDSNGADIWKKQVEMGIEGDGNDAILSNFGRGVKEVAQHWLVREEDGFTYPGYAGLEITPPTWNPTGKGKVIRVVYPIIKDSNVVEYHIGEREDVLKNLIAHINNNLMNETFGIAASRYKADAKQKKQIAEKKATVIKRAEELGLEKALDDEELQNYISPAWKDPQSRESMIIRKIRNNITKKIPKDFGNAFVVTQYEETTDESYSQMRREVNENANKEPLDIQPEITEEKQTPSSHEEHVKDEPEPESEPTPEIVEDESKQGAEDRKAQDPEQLDLTSSFEQANEAVAAGTDGAPF